MLIQTPAKPQDIITIKLTSGEELIAKFEEEDDGSLTVGKPFALVPNQQGLGMVPWIMSTNPDTKVSINKNTVVCFLKTDDGIGKQYLQQTTGLTMVTN